MDIAVGTVNDVFKASNISNPKYVPFEMMKMPIPEKYENILNTYYGDWHKLVRGENIHGGCIFDVKLPYSQYLDKEK